MRARLSLKKLNSGGGPRRNQEAHLQTFKKALVRYELFGIVVPTWQEAHQVQAALRKGGSFATLAGSIPTNVRSRKADASDWSARRRDRADAWPRGALRQTLALRPGSSGKRQQHLMVRSCWVWGGSSTLTTTSSGYRASDRDGGRPELRHRLMAKAQVTSSLWARPAQPGTSPSASEKQASSHHRPRRRPPPRHPCTAEQCAVRRPRLSVSRPGNPTTHVYAGIERFRHFESGSQNDHQDPVKKRKDFHSEKVTKP